MVVLGSHNYSYTLLVLRIYEDHPYVKEYLSLSMNDVLNR